MIAELFKQCACPRREWPRCKHAFHFRKMVNGRRWCVSIDEWLGHEQIRSVGAAESTARTMIDAMKAGTFSPAGPAGQVAARGPRTSHGHTFTTIAGLYYDGIKDDPERRPHDVANLKSLIAVVTGWRMPGRTDTLGELPIAAIDNPLIERFYKAQVAAGKSVSYRNKMVQFLRAFSRWAVREGYRPTPWIAPDDPGVTVKRRKAATRQRRLALPELDARGRVLVAGEFDRLLAVAEPRLRDLCTATFQTGARLAELTRLRWRDVDLPRNVVTFRDSKDPDRVKSRTIPLSEVLRGVLLRRQIGPDGEKHDRDASVFGNAVGEPVGSIATAWQNAVLKSHGLAVTRHPTKHGLTRAAREAYAAIDLVFHDLRHEAASQWLESGRFDVVEISFLLGHTSLETTQIYLNVRPTGLAAKFAALDRDRAGDAGKSGVPVAYETKTPPDRALKMVMRKGRKSSEVKELA